MYKIYLIVDMILFFTINILCMSSDHLNEMSEKDLFNLCKRYFIDDKIHLNKYDVNKYYNEIYERIQGSHTSELENLMLQEIEHPKLSPEERKAYKFQVLCSRIINHAKFPETYEQMTSILKDRNIFKHPFWTENIIKKLSFEKFDKAIPVLSDIAYNNDNINPDIQIAAASSLAVIGKEGVDLLINNFIEWENLQEDDPEKQTTPLLWPLRYSRDKRALPLAWRHINSEKLGVRVQALSVLASLGATISGNFKNKIQEAKKMKNEEFEMFISCPYISKKEREKIKNLLLNSLNNYHCDYSIRLIAAKNLKYYPFPDVIEELKNCMNNDPYHSIIEKNDYPVRNEAKKSMEFLKKYYPKFFKSIDCNIPG